MYLILDQRGLCSDFGTKHAAIHVTGELIQKVKTMKELAERINGLVDEFYGIESFYEDVQFGNLPEGVTLFREEDIDGPRWIPEVTLENQDEEDNGPMICATEGYFFFEAWTTDGPIETEQVYYTKFEKLQKLLADGKEEITYNRFSEGE